MVGPDGTDIVAEPDPLKRSQRQSAIFNLELARSNLDVAGPMGPNELQRVIDDAVAAGYPHRVVGQFLLGLLPSLPKPATK